MEDKEEEGGLGAGEERIADGGAVGVGNIHGNMRAMVDSTGGKG